MHRCWGMQVRHLKMSGLLWLTLIYGRLTFADIRKCRITDASDFQIYIFG